MQSPRRHSSQQVCAYISREVLHMREDVPICVLYQSMAWDLLLINENEEKRKSVGNQHSNTVWPAPSHFSVLNPVNWTPQTVSWNRFFLYYITFDMCFFTRIKKKLIEFGIAKMKKLEISNCMLYAIISKAYTCWPLFSSAPCWPFSRVSHTSVDVYHLCARYAKGRTWVARLFPSQQNIDIAVC